MPKPFIDITQIIEQSRSAAALAEQLEYTKKDQRRQIKTHDVDGVTYRITENGELQPMPKVRMATIGAGTLAAIADYVKSDPDKLGGANFFVHVANPNEVALYGAASGADKERQCYVRAKVVDRSNLGTYGGKFLDQDTFGIWLLTAFAQSAEWSYVRNVAGKIKSEKVAESEDNGFGQVVAVRMENKTEHQEVKNPIMLAPFRSFPEIPPVEEAFALRLRSGEEGQPPKIALFEADSGAWAVEAVARIKGWLATELPETPILG